MSTFILNMINERKKLFLSSSADGELLNNGSKPIDMNASKNFLRSGNDFGRHITTASTSNLSSAYSNNDIKICLEPAVGSCALPRTEYYCDLESFQKSQMYSQ